MFLQFDILPEHSRIWIYQANRSFNSREVSIISNELSAFTDGWAAHGVPLRSSFDIRFNQFVILAADENVQEASGCSIDDSVRKVKELEQKIGVDLFDRKSIAFLKDKDVITLPMNDLKGEYDNGVWHGSTLVFNNVITRKGELNTGWLIPAKTTWLKRYLPRETIAG
ncbi:MAG TPA: hypothetical protein VFD46_14470 [Chryseolinea sp.]|nr:hypothetical protein [Chryseolinea sp.]